MRPPWPVNKTSPCACSWISHASAWTHPGPKPTSRDRKACRIFAPNVEVEETREQHVRLPPGEHLPRDDVDRIARGRPRGAVRASPRTPLPAAACPVAVPVGAASVVRPTRASGASVAVAAPRASSSPVTASPHDPRSRVHPRRRRNVRDGCGAGHWFASSSGRGDGTGSNTSPPRGSLGEATREVRAGTHGTGLRPARGGERAPGDSRPRAAARHRRLLGFNLYADERPGLGSLAS